MDALIDFFRQLPGWVIEIAVFAWQHPVFPVIGVIAGAAAAVSFLINAKSWRKGK